MEKTLSLIIPTYNMEKYLQKCLDSVIVPDDGLLDSLEVIIVNDGSRDKSSEIAHSYESRFPMIFRVIDKENGNYGSCVNTGLTVATGKYVKILDADDYFDTTGFCEYLTKLNTVDTDLILNDKITVNQHYIKTGEQVIPIVADSILNFDEISSRWQAIDMHKMAYRRKLLKDIGYRQTEGISYSDAEWMIKPFANINSAFNTGVNVYCYLQGRSGQTIDKLVRKRSFHSLHKMIISIADYWNSFIGEPKRKQFLRDYLIYSVINIYREFFFETRFDKSEFRAFDKEMVTNYPEIIVQTDAHQWVSFIPHLKLSEDWRRGRKCKFFIEYSIILSYLKLSNLLK